MRLGLVLLVCGCASLKPLPQQSLDCLAKEAPSALASAASALANHETSAAMEAALEVDALGALWCIAQAALTDWHTAHQVAEATAVTVETVQAHAQVYLEAKAATNPQ